MLIIALTTTFATMTILWNAGRIETVVAKLIGSSVLETLGRVAPWTSGIMTAIASSGILFQAGALTNPLIAMLGGVGCGILSFLAAILTMKACRQSTG